MSGHFENELTQALARVSPPGGFAQRVLDRLPGPKQKESRWQALLAIAAAIALAAGLTFRWHYKQKEHERVERAQQELIFALRLTAEKLTVVEAHLKKSAPHLRIKKKEQL